MSGAEQPLEPSSGLARVGGPSGSEHPFDAMQIFQDRKPSTVRVLVFEPGEEEAGPRFGGSGVMVSSGDPKACEFATVNHVTKGAEHIVVTASDGLTYPASLELVDEPNEIAVYEIQKAFHPERICKPATVRTTELAPNELVLAIGDQAGPMNAVPYIGQNLGTIKRSEISQELPALAGENMDRSMGEVMSRFIMSDSGGPAFDSEGRVVGLMTAQIKPGIAVFEKGLALQHDLDIIKGRREQ